jgi:hypothetical protein
MHSTLRSASILSRFGTNSTALRTAPVTPFYSHGRISCGRFSKSTSSIMSSPSDAVCSNCSDLDLPGIFAGGFVIKDGFISRKSQPSARWLWQKVENCKFCNFLGESQCIAPYFSLVSTRSPSPRVEMVEERAK